ncbi:DUF3173 family protein [Streptococcus hyovaginalis]|nr:DUF3173 family protein [Streptococcus hyovaginalis]HEM6115828.1 DUF3173 family protein [Streptococcus suis]
MQYKKKTVNHFELMSLGFPEHTARDIIKEAKSIAVASFRKSSESSNNMIQLVKSPFDNVRLDLAPTYIVEGMLGFELPPIDNRKELDKHD